MIQTKKRSATGSYRWDEQQGRVVKVSDRVPGLSKNAAQGSPCGKPPSMCGGGACG